MHSCSMDFMLTSGSLIIIIRAYAYIRRCPMRLVGTYVSPFARRVAAALVSRSIAYEHEDLNGYANPVRARELNPVGKVPILILDDGERLIDSAAIFDHLNEVVGPRHAL